MCTIRWLENFKTGPLLAKACDMLDSDPSHTIALQYSPFYSFLVLSTQVLECLTV